MTSVVTVNKVDGKKSYATLSVRARNLYYVSAPDFKDVVKEQFIVIF